MSSDAGSEVAARVRAVLDQRLARGLDAPLAVALSGGGDSLALLRIARAWAGSAGRRLIAFTVDHQLQPQGAAWARWCAARAADLGVAHRTLVWEGDKPATGLADAARAARHGLIAQAARRAGARVILMGHTADDALEAAAMRAAGVRVSAPRVWSPAPVWPEGRGLFILRPLSGVRRGEIRMWLAARGEAWIEDPVNRDPAKARTRARAALAAAPGVAPPAPPREPAAWPPVGIGPAGDLSLAAADLARLAPGPGHAFLAAAVTCVSGRQAPPRGAAVDRLIARLAGGGEGAATLGGARVEAAEGQVSITREAGRRRAEAGLVRLPVGEALVWDGRFEITAATASLWVRPLGGLAARLSRAERARLRGLPRAARGMAPAVIDGAGAVTCPILAPDARLAIRCLIESRLRAASGCIQQEVAI